MIVADLSLPAERFLFSDVIGDHPAVRLDLVELAATNDPPAVYCWVMGPERTVASFVDDATAGDSVSDLTRLDRRDRKRLYHATLLDPLAPFLDALRTHDVLVDRARGSSDGWELRVQCPDTETLSAFRSTCSDAGVEVTVDRQFALADLQESSAIDLTPEQREALVLARREGYFDVPRGITLEELGGMLDISRQAVSNRLRRGTRHLVDANLSLGSADESAPAGADDNRLSGAD